MIKVLKKEPFIDKAIHTSCDAFMREDFFSFKKGETGHEFYPDLSWMKKLPFLRLNAGERIQGRFNFLSDSAADLYLVCSHFEEIDEEYYVFFNADWDNPSNNGWVIWTPNSKHYNEKKGLDTIRKVEEDKEEYEKLYADNLEEDEEDA